MKKCSHCKETRPFSDFGKNRAMKDGYQNQCRACRSEYHYKNKTKLNKKCREWYKNNKDHVLQYNRSYWKTPSGRISKKKSQDRYRTKYPEKYAAHLAVSSAKNRGLIPRASELKCMNCNNQAYEYHHYMGYNEKHHLDVIPLCIPCHKRLERE